jgi:membrane fusion protein, multidrug efflux system
MNTMATDQSLNSHGANHASPKQIHKGPTVGSAEPAGQPETPTTPPQAPVAPSKRRSRKWALLVGSVVALAAAGYFLYPLIDTALNTVSTDDAYVNGHVTLVAPRINGQVKQVLVEDNQRVKKGDLLVQIDPRPFAVLVALKRSALEVAEANLAAAESKARGLEAQLGSQRWKLQSASEQVDTQVALLKAQAAALRTQEATLERAQSDFERAQRLVGTAAVSREEFDQRKQQIKVANASVDQAREAVHQTRVALGLAPEPANGKNLTDVPPNLNQTYSGVRTALTDCMQTLAQLGQPLGSTDLTPNKALEEFRRLDEKGDIDRILRDLVPKAPSVQQAKAELEQARHDLEQAELNLSYCDIVSEIDGVVTSRNVNPGNNVQVGQSLMAVRSVTEIWIDANFKETQLADLRIGQRVRCEVDMYGSRKEFEGRITGFTMGTGQTLALLPPQNATGNFVKIVQRLPVRIELMDYDPDQAPLFIGLSVTSYVHYKEPDTGPQAGAVLQQVTIHQQGPTIK